MNIGVLRFFEEQPVSGASRIGGLLRFAIIGKVSPAWRYRLGVRTEDSQSSNPGSIPGSATKLYRLSNQLLTASLPMTTFVRLCLGSGLLKGSAKALVP